jgi:hypothetical protein
MAPSFIAHVLNGILMFAAVVVVYMNVRFLSRLDPYKKVMILLVFSVAIGIHALSHLGLESVYGFNPFKVASP